MTPVSFVRLRHWPGLAPVAMLRFDGVMAPTPLPQDRPVRWGILATGGIAATVTADLLALPDECEVVADHLNLKFDRDNRYSCKMHGKAWASACKNCLKVRAGHGVVLS